MTSDAEMLAEGAPGEQLARLRAIMHRLRAPGGCPWDAEQTHASLLANLIEETYETVDAIRREDWPHLREELGDLLLQVVFHAELAAEAGRFDFDDIARGIAEKLIRRHPHVFALGTAATPEAVLSQWEEIKRGERGEEQQAYLHGVGHGLPAMLRAVKLQRKASKVGFDWPDLGGVFAKIREETEEVAAALAASCGAPGAAVRGEVGDLLFAVVNLARKLGIDPEEALEETNRKFTRRFAEVEAGMQARGRSLTTASLEEMEDLWQAAKQHDC
jgi:MazG family protein